MAVYSQVHLPNIICGRGSVSFVTTLGKKRIAVIGYHESVEQMAKEIFRDTDAEICYIATITREPMVGDIFENLVRMREFEPDMILAIGGGSVMDMAKALHLFYENPSLSFEDSLKPFALPELGKKAVSVSVPTTSGTGSETSSAAVFIDEETKVKKLLLSNTLIPHYAVLDSEFTDQLPHSIQIATGLDALCHAVESVTAANTNSYTKAIAMESAIDIMEYLPIAVDGEASEEVRKDAKERLHTAASMAGMAITNSFTGIVHSYDHPGPTFQIPHGITCGIMLPRAVRLIGPREEYASLARRLGYQGDVAELSGKLADHIQELSVRLGVPESFAAAGVDREEYESRMSVWAEISLDAIATKLSPAKMDHEKGIAFYRACYGE